MIGRLQKLAAGISDPFLGKESDGFRVGNFLTSRNTFPRDSCIQCGRKVAARAERQMSDLGGAGVHFDQIRVIGVRFQNKIKAVESGKVEPPRNFFYCDRHLPMIDQAQNGGVSSRMHLFQDLEMQSS